VHCLQSRSTCTSHNPTSRHYSPGGCVSGTRPSYACHVRSRSTGWAELSPHALVIMRVGLLWVHGSPSICAYEVHRASAEMRGRVGAAVRPREAAFGRIAAPAGVTNAPAAPQPAPRQRATGMCGPAGCGSYYRQS
jgi:hypothetical protein